MQVFYELIPQNRPTAIALGLFDGVHTAHARVIRAATEYPELTPTVLTFRTGVLPNKAAQPGILSEEQRLERISLLGIGQTFLPDFRCIADMSPEDFFEKILRKTLHAHALSCGYDYTFGKAASGNAKLLAQLCEHSGIRLSILPRIECNGRPISSTAIRAFLQNGDIPAANALLGYRYTLVGKIFHGRSLGRTLGFPTINQYFSAGQLIPKYGVYHTTASIDGICYPGITNIGVKPTVTGENLPLAETHLIGAQGNFYGKCARIEFLKMTRTEQKFESIEALRDRVQQDIRERIEAEDAAALRQ